MPATGARPRARSPACPATRSARASWMSGARSCEEPGELVTPRECVAEAELDELARVLGFEHQVTREQAARCAASADDAHQCAQAEGQNAHITRGQLCRIQAR